MPFVYTNPNGDADVFKDDVVFVLSQKQPTKRLRSASFAWAQASKKNNKGGQREDVAESLLRHARSSEEPTAAVTAESGAAAILMDLRSNILMKLTAVNSKIEDLHDRIAELEGVPKRGVGGRGEEEAAEGEGSRTLLEGEGSSKKAQNVSN